MKFGGVNPETPRLVHWEHREGRSSSGTTASARATAPSFRRRPACSPKTLVRPWTIPGLEPGSVEIQDPVLRAVFVEAYRNWEKNG